MVKYKWNKLRKLRPLHCPVGSGCDTLEWMGEVGSEQEFTALWDQVDAGQNPNPYLVSRGENLTFCGLLLITNVHTNLEPAQRNTPHRWTIGLNSIVLTGWYNSNVLNHLYKLGSSSPITVNSFVGRVVCQVNVFTNEQHVVTNWFWGSGAFQYRVCNWTN